MRHAVRHVLGGSEGEGGEHGEPILVKLEHVETTVLYSVVRSVYRHTDTCRYKRRTRGGGGGGA